MLDSVPPTGAGGPPSPSDPSSSPTPGGPNKMYLAPKAMEIWRHYWQALFPKDQLTDTQVQQMTDNFIKFVWDQMNTVLQDALAKQKERDQDEKEQRGG